MANATTVMVAQWTHPEAGQDDDGPRMMARGGGRVLRYHAWEWNMSHDGDSVSITRHSGRQNHENDERCVLGELVWLARVAGVVHPSLVLAAEMMKVAGIGRLRRLAG